MIANAAGILIFLSVCGIVASNPDRAVDCRKFVFAPLCRGVAAKRVYPNPGHYESAPSFTEENVKELLKSYFAVPSLDAEDEENYKPGTSPSKQNEVENAGAMHQQDRVNRFLRYLFGSKRNYSERDSFPAQEFENL